MSTVAGSKVACRLGQMEGVRWLSADEQEAWRLFLRFYRTFADRLNEDLSPFGFDQADYEILALLSEAPDRQLRMSELADVAVFPNSRLTYRITQLVQRGFVERIKCETDGRGSFAHLTPEGQETVERLAPVHVDGVRRYLFEQVTEPELGQFTAFLQHALRRLDGD